MIIKWTLDGTGLANPPTLECEIDPSELAEVLDDQGSSNDVEEYVYELIDELMRGSIFPVINNMPELLEAAEEMLEDSRK